MKKNELKKDGAQTIKNDHGSLWRELRKGYLDPSNKWFFYYENF